jgi:hypothetical protein
MDSTEVEFTYNAPDRSTPCHRRNISVSMMPGLKVDAIKLQGGPRASGDPVGKRCGETTGHRGAGSARDTGDEDEGGGRAVGAHRSERKRARKEATNRSLRAR